MKSLYKVLLILIIAISIHMIIPQNIVQAKPSDLVGLVVPENPDETKYTGVTDLIGKVLGFLQIVSGFISVVVIAFTGFKYIIADNINIKTELKEKMLPLIIGIVLIFCATSITQFLLGAVRERHNSSSQYVQWFDE